MQAIKDSLMRSICRPELLNEIKNRFNNLNFKTFNFGSYGEIRGHENGVYMGATDKATRAYIKYSASGPGLRGPGPTCESITFWPSEFKSELVAHRCYDAPFDARLYQETCKSYQTSNALSYIPQTVGVIIGIGAAWKAYKNFDEGHDRRAAIWAAVSIASIALPFFLSLSS